MLIGVTGGIACGKSEVGRALTRAGVAVWDADDAAHALMEPGRPVYRRVVRAFGRGIVGSDGHIDRRELGRLVFADAAERARLNAIVHPAVARDRARWVRVMRAHGGVAAAIIPLLFEVRAVKDWSAIVCVSAPMADVKRRLQRRGLSAADAMRRIRAQMPLREKRKRADYVIENDGTKRALAAQVRRLLRQIVTEGDPAP